jgi:hypothetical protein
VKLLAIVLIVGGVLGLVYGGFTLLTGRHTLDLGFTELSAWDRERVNVPVWVGVVAVAAGAAMLYFRRPA